MVKKESLAAKILETGVYEEIQKFLEQDLPEPQFNPDAVRILEKRYLLKNPETGEVIETPKELLARVVVGVTNIPYYKENREVRNKVMRDYYVMLAKLDFLPNSPTLMNAGKKDGMLSACFVIPVPDNLQGIMNSVTNVALIHKVGGGTGMDFSDLRPQNAPVRATAGVSSGPVSFMKIFDATTEQIKAGGARRGANMGILRCLPGDTLISTLEGPKFIKDLVGKNPYVYSIDTKDKTLHIVKADKVFISDHNRKMVRVWFDNDTFLDCTEDHKIMLSNCEYVEAQNLKFGDSIMAFNSCLQKHSNGKNNHQIFYRRIGITGQVKSLEHIMVATEILKKEVKDMCVHHKDGSSTNNLPENIEVMTRSDHASLHVILDGHLIEHQERIVNERRGKTLEEVYSEETVTKWKNNMSGPRPGGKKPIVEELGKNHKVVRVEQLEELADIVYDISLPEYHNFVANGVFVHNCDHPNILDFISCKDDGTTLTNFNISVAITEDFMKAMEKDENYDLIDPSTKKVVASLSAREVWKMLVEHAHKTGDPGVIFIDKVNEKNLMKGDNHKIKATNPCVTGDTPILTDKGYVSIKSVVGKTINVWNGEEFSEVQPRVTGKNQEIVRVSFSDGSYLDCTPYHKFYIETKNSRNSKVVTVEAKDLTSGMKLEKFTLPVIEADNKIEQMSVKEAYTRGVFAGDGSVETNRERSSIWLYGSKRKLLPFLEYDSVNECAGDRLFVKLHNNDWSKTWVPSIQESVEVRLAWLAGLLDTDAGACGSGAYSIWSVEYKFLYNTKLMLNTLGVSSTLTLGKEAQVKEMPDGKGGVKEYPTKDVWRLTISGNSLASLSKMGLVTYRVDTSYIPSRKTTQFIKVKDITPLSEIAEEVYCFTENKRHRGIFGCVATGQCGEQPLESYESCNLGSINVANFIDRDRRAIDWVRLNSIIDLSTRFLNDVVDASKFPLQEITDKVQANRKIGLGVMGFADVLIELEIPYNTKQGQRIARKLMKTVNETATKVSHELAERDGAFPSWNESVWADKEYSMRNAALTTIAPTGTISMLANGTSSGIEPVFSLAFIKNVMDGQKFYYVHPALLKLVENGEITSEQFELIKSTGHLPEEILREFPHLVTAHDIDPVHHVEMQSTFQEHVHAAVSKTVNLPNDATTEDVDNIYRMAYASACKGITIYRDGSKDGQVLTSGTDTNKTEDNTPPTTVHPTRIERGDSLDGKTIKIKTGCGSLYVTISVDSDGKPLEVFCRLGKSGGCSSANMEVYGRLISGWLRAGMPIDELTKQLRGISCSNPAFVPGGRTLSCADAVGIAIERYMDGQFGRITNDSSAGEEDMVGDTQQKSLFSKVALKGGSCPECGGPMEYEGGCAVCRICAHSKCG